LIHFIDLSNLNLYEEKIVTQRHSVLPKTSKIIAIRSGAGKFKDIFTILSSLPAGFPASILMIQQPTAFLPDYAATILDSEIALRVKQAENGERLSSGVVYVTLPKKSFIITPDRKLCLQSTANFDPAAGVLLTSLASNCKADAIAVALTEQEDLFALQTIRQYGGKVIAPTQAKFTNSLHPQAAVDAQVFDFMLPLEQIASLLMHLVMPEQFSKSSQLETR
jgi:two-component system chemotaxis response regulator CheB